MSLISNTNTATVEAVVEEAPVRRPSRRGFAAMDGTRQRQIASLGGRTAHKRGQAHQFTSEEARLAGRKGGESVSRDRDYMADIGRRGGAARSLRRQALMKAQPQPTA